MSDTVNYINYRPVPETFKSRINKLKHVLMPVCIQNRNESAKSFTFILLFKNLE